MGPLDDVFSDNDALVEMRSLEKIKTIGDVYMAATAVPHPRDDHAEALCDLALEIHKLTETRTFSGHSLRFRIGITRARGCEHHRHQGVQLRLVG